MNVPSLGSSQDVYATDMAFEVGLPDQAFVVTLTLSGTGNSADMVAVTLDGYSEGSFATGNGPVTESFDAIVQNGELMIELAGGNGSHHNYAAITGLTIEPKAVPMDFDGDGKSDFAVYGLIPGTNLYGFQILTSSSGFTQTITWDNQGYGFGSASSIPVVGDYFGEGKPAYAIWSPNGSGGMILQAISSVNPAESLSINFGLTTDVPVVADVDGDGKADFGVFGYDPNLGWRFDFLLSSRGFDPDQTLIFNNYGDGYGSSAASPVVGDFDGSGRDGLGVYIPSGSSGTFYYTNFAFPRGTGPVINPTATVYFTRTYGFSTDIVMPVDYTGDGIDDLAFYGLDPRTGLYRYDLLLASTDFNTTDDLYFDNAGYGYGYSASLPTMADYEGDGHADFSVYQPDGNYVAIYVYQDVAVGHGVVYDFGTPSDLPLTTPAWVLAKKVRSQ